MNRVLIGRAREVWILADHSKANQIRPAIIDEIPAAHLIITDDAAPDDFVKAIEAQGVRVVAI